MSSCRRYRDTPGPKTRVKVNHEILMGTFSGVLPLAHLGMYARRQNQQMTKLFDMHMIELG